MGRHPINQKQQFLRSKGLTEQEIQIACERAGVFARGPNDSVLVDIHTANTSPYQPLLNSRKPTSRFKQFLEICNSIAAVSGIAYCVFLFYKRFIEPLLYGSPKPEPKKSVDESLKELEANMGRRMDELNAELIKVREDIKFQNIKSDLDAIKGLLLNKKQFASPIVPPSIPAWQLAAAASTQLAPEELNRTGGDPDKDGHDDNDTGSGSSETEIVTKNSDSSLEIM